MEQKKESVDYGVIIARKDGTFVVDNYHVCPKSIDPYGKYDFDDVKAYAAANSDKVQPEPELPNPTPEQIAEAKRQATLAQLDELDRKSARYLRAKVIGTIDEEGENRLVSIEAEVQTLRKSL